VKWTGSRNSVIGSRTMVFIRGCSVFLPTLREHRRWSQRLARTVATSTNLVDRLLAGKNSIQGSER
jgi:hypothetical protein